jgi:ATP-dependent DNA helicase RecQ
MYDLMRATGLSQKAISMILADLEEQRFIQRHPKDRTYRVIGRLTKVNFSDYDAVRMKKQQELEAMQNYVHYAGCYMGYLTEYLGDPAGYHCGVCGHCAENRFPLVLPAERIPGEVTHFLEKEFLPRIEKRGTHKQPIHEAGWSLSYHGDSLIGKLVRASKYEGAGPFAQELVVRAAGVIQTRYPIAAIDGIVSVPPTRSGLLVEGFARQVANLLGKEYLPLLVKVRPTQEQQILTNHVQKSDNVKGAFSVMFPVQLVGRVLLLIDDIYDSGYMLREVAQTLMRAGAKVVYPFTITRTVHSDDQ